MRVGGTHMLKKRLPIIIIVIVLLTAIAVPVIIFSPVFTSTPPPRLADSASLVFRDDFPDPSVIQYEGVTYAFATGMRVMSSADLITWKREERVFDKTPDWGTNGAGFWAPDIVKIGEKFILYYSLSTWGDPNPGIGVASADHPAGPWTDHGKLFRSLEIGVDNSIDPAVFIGQDDGVYMIWGSFRGLFGVELTADGLALKDGIEGAKKNKTLVAGIVGEWNGNTYEAPYIIWHSGYYYLFVSLGTCCAGLDSTYRIHVARSENPLGPYKDHKDRNMFKINRGRPLLAGKNNGHGSIVAPGHNSVALDDIGQHWIIYHCYYNDNGTAKGRWVALDRLVWTACDWPEVSGTLAETQGPVYF